MSANPHVCQVVFNSVILPLIVTKWLIVQFASRLQVLRDELDLSVA
jgi:hypothetical protein